MSDKLKLINLLASRKNIGKVLPSSRKNKKYMVNYRGTPVHFGDSRYEDFLDHKDNERRHRYRQRASKIVNKLGQLTYKIRGTPNYYSYHLLW